MPKAGQIESVDFAQPEPQHTQVDSVARPSMSHNPQPWDFSLLREVLDSPPQELLKLPDETPNISTQAKEPPTNGVQLSTADLKESEAAQKPADIVTDESGTDSARIVSKSVKSKAPVQQAPNIKKNLSSSKGSDNKPAQHHLANNQVKSTKTNWNQSSNLAFGRDKVERDIAYRLKLMQYFPEDRLSIARNITLKYYPGSKPLHIFIDYSNMYIGYQTFLQRHNNNGNLTGRQPRLCIESLIFLLERGRAVERRHLAGSKPWQSAFGTAERAGYNCTILEKVAKPFYATNDNNRVRGRPRSAEFQERFRFQADEAISSTQYGSSPEKSITRYVEQGVDEILQLKMSLSIIDLKRADQKAMVLATGDGAEAEYSDGFASMVERALEDGWLVELVSWEHCTSSVYKQKQWLAQWPPGQFRFIALDPFVNELHECK